MNQVLLYKQCDMSYMQYIVYLTVLCNLYVYGKQKNKLFQLPAEYKFGLGSKEN